MAYKIQSSFGAGEIDPALQERTTLEKYKSGLATARGCLIGKTGRIISKNGSLFRVYAKYANKKCVLYSPPYSNVVIEWGDLYVRIHNITTGAINELSHTWVEADLPYVHFASYGNIVRIMRQGKSAKVLDLSTLLSVLSSSRYIRFPSSPGLFGHSWVITASAGYRMDYAFTVVENGLESMALPLSDAAYLLPIASNQKNFFTIDVDDTLYDITKVTEMRVYRRPYDSGAYGYVGSSFELKNPVPSTYQFNFTDFGQSADFTHIPPDYGYDFINDVTGGRGNPTVAPRTGVWYQQRFFLSGTLDESLIHATRTGYDSRSFTRDYPYSSESSLSFKCTNEGTPKVLRMFDAGVLLAFTTAGLFVSDPGPITPTNIAMNRRGEWVIDDIVPPLSVPGGIVFVDRLTNSVVALTFSTERESFVGDEISIYSNHLLQNKRIVSWAFQDGLIPTIVSVLDDGSLLYLTYNKEQLMQAWTHSDQDALYESVTAYKNLDGTSKLFFVVKRNGFRNIETTCPRYVSDHKTFVGMDSAVTYNGLFAFTFTAVRNTDDWDGLLTLTGSGAAFANTADNGAVGSTFRYFDRDGASTDLVVTQYISTTQVIVQPSNLFPAEEAVAFSMYKTKNVLTGLDHLEGLAVSVYVDGYVYGSPNNDIEDYENYVVTGGSITLEDSRRGAIVTIGAPFVMDVETLDIDTLEQKPTYLESKIVPNVTITVLKSRGFYVAQKFPDNDLLTQPVEDETPSFEMASSETLTEEDDDILGNAAEPPYDDRIPLVIPREWDSNGRICIRHVDPTPLEISAITPDIEVYRK